MGVISSRRNFEQIRNEQELFGHAGSPIQVRAGAEGYDRADLDDEAMAQRVMEEENARRIERQRDRMMHEERLRQEQRSRTDQELNSIQRRYDEQRRETSRQTFEPSPRFEAPQQEEPVSGRNKETLTLSGDLSAGRCNSGQAPPGTRPLPPQLRNDGEAYPSDRHNALRGTTYSRSSDTRELQGNDEYTDDGEVSSGNSSSYEESGEESAARDLLSQANPVSSISLRKKSDAPSHTSGLLMPPEMQQKIRAVSSMADTAPRDQINNTKDLNPMIMMSGEEGSASRSNNLTSVNLTTISGGQPIAMSSIERAQHFGSTAGINPMALQATGSQMTGQSRQNLPSINLPGVSPSNYRLNLQNLTRNSQTNPFATQNVAGMQEEAKRHEAEAAAGGAGAVEDYQLWTGRNEHGETVEHEVPKRRPLLMQASVDPVPPYQGLRPDQSSILDNTNLSYFNGQQVPAPPGKMRYIVETQDRHSIMS